MRRDAFLFWPQLFDTVMETYTNPINVIPMGDPFVLLHQGIYYLFGTTDPGKGFRVFVSDNMVDWQAQGFAYRHEDTSWGRPPYWAPEVFAYQGRFYMTYSARDPVSGLLLTALAVSSSPAGPYDDLYAPWFNLGYSAIDSHLFLDSDGSVYIYFSKNGEKDGYSFGIIYGARVKDDLSGLASHPKLLLEADQPWERIRYAKNRANEGPFVIKKHGTYFMTYSANHTFMSGYGIGYATADAPLGPWLKSNENPIAGTSISDGFSGAGHNSITKSPDLKEHFIVYHTHADPDHPENQIRTTNIDRIEFKSSGKVILHGPTRTPQRFPSRSPE